MPGIGTQQLKKTKRSLAFTSYWGWEIETDKKQETSTLYWWNILRKKRNKKKSKWPVLVSSPRAVLWVGGSRHFTIPNRHPLKQFHPTTSQVLSRKTSIKAGSLLGRAMHTWSENPEKGSQLCYGCDSLAVWPWTNHSTSLNLIPSCVKW